MPAALRKPQLIGQFIASVKSCGWDALILNDGHPAKLLVFSSDQRVLVWLYIWNLTHGGIPRNPNELRIQTTGLDRFREESGVKTLILGWSDEEQAFAGFDASKHRLNMKGRSPSFQIRRETLKATEAIGLKTQIRNNQEIVVAFRPDMTVTYVESLEKIHGSAERVKDLQTLEEMVTTSATARIIDIPPGPAK